MTFSLTLEGEEDLIHIYLYGLENFGGLEAEILFLIEKHL
jgi:toxin ParE1/3/4